jgi:hypothetical protein
MSELAAKKMSRLSIIPIMLFFGLTKVFGQASNLKLEVDSLQYLNHQPFTCNSTYWRVVAKGKEVIPFLIGKLDDTTSTQISLTCKPTDVKVGDICFEALTEICVIPIFYITHLQFDFFDQNGCQQAVFNYLANNRQKFKAQIRAYYDKYKTDLKLIRYQKSYQNDCKKLNHIIGYYDVDWKLLDKNSG